MWRVRRAVESRELSPHYPRRIPPRQSCDWRDRGPASALVASPGGGDNHRTVRIPVRKPRSGAAQEWDMTRRALSVLLAMGVVFAFGLRALAEDGPAATPELVAQAE